MAIAELEVDRDTVARILGITPESVNRLTQRGMPRQGHGVYFLPDVVQWAVREAGKGSNDARTALYVAQTAKTELDVEITRGDHVPKEEVQQRYLELLSIMIQLCDGLPMRAAADVTRCSIIGENVAILREHCHATRDELSRQLSALASTAHTGSSSGQPAAAKKRGAVGRPRKKRAARKPATGKVG